MSAMELRYVKSVRRVNQKALRRVININVSKNSKIQDYEKVVLSLSPCTASRRLHIV